MTTVPAILATIGHPLGRYGRTTCPIHQGKNPQVFRYDDDRWHCYAGCGSGQVKKLRRLLGIEDDVRAPPRRQHPVKGILVNDDLDIVPPPRVTELLAGMVVELHRKRDDWAGERHRRAERLSLWIGRYLTLGRRSPALQGLCTARITGFWIQAQVLYDQAHAAWGRWPYPCGCYEPWRPA